VPRQQIQDCAIGIGAISKRHDHAAAHALAAREVLGLDLEPRHHAVRRREREADAEHLAKTGLMLAEECQGIQAFFANAE
jgi:hypothetical protein